MVISISSGSALFAKIKTIFMDKHCYTLEIDSFHIVSAHAPNSLVPHYLREITHEGATLHYTMEHGKRFKEK